MIRTVLTDVQWAAMAPHCLGREFDPGRIGPDPPLFVEAVLRFARTGCRLQPARSGALIKQAAPSIMVTISASYTT